MGNSESQNLEEDKERMHLHYYKQGQQKSLNIGYDDLIDRDTVVFTFCQG